MTKDPRGRKPIPAKEKKKAVYIFVKEKFVTQAKVKLKQIEREYNSKEMH